MNRINITIIFTLLFFASSKGQGLINEILDFGKAEYSSTSAEEYKLEAEILRKNFGITFNASAQHRLGEGFIEGDLSENNGQTFYKAGISWELLKGGLFYNQSEADRIGLKSILELVKEERASKNRSYFAQYSYTSYLFDKRIMDLYLSREHLLKTKKQLFSSLTKQGYFTNKEQLGLESRLNEVSFQLKNITFSNQAFTSIFGELLLQMEATTSMPDINITILLQELDTSPGLEAILKAQKELNSEPNFWVDEVSVKASLNYNHQVSFIDSRRDFASVGLSVSIPLYKNNGLRNNRHLLVDKKIEEAYQYEIANLKKEVWMLFQEYAFKQKQLANTFSSQKIVEEKLRVEMLQKVSVNAALPLIDASLLQDDLLLVNIEQLSISKQMVQILVKMNSLLPDYKITKYLNYNSSEILSSLREVK